MKTRIFSEKKDLPVGVSTLDHYDENGIAEYFFDDGELAIHGNSFEILWRYFWYDFFLHNRNDIDQILQVHYMVFGMFGVEQRKVILFRADSDLSITRNTVVSYNKELSLGLLEKEFGPPSDFWQYDPELGNSWSSYFVFNPHFGVE